MYRYFKTFICNNLVISTKRSMTYFKLPNFDQSKWTSIKSSLIDSKLSSLDDIKRLISDFSDNNEFATIDNLKENYRESELVSLISNIVRTAAKIEEIRPDGKLPRLCAENRVVKLSRHETLCILANMFVCTVEKSNRNPYWVTFSNWLGDGRPIATVYLRTLLEYFRQSFDSSGGVINLDETIVFERRQLDRTRLQDYLDSDRSEFKAISFDLTGSIGDRSQIEVDFANMDIGFGVTGTQEEILFGKHPELCVSMLFADTMRDNEAIVISNCRKVGVYEGYGMNLKFNSVIEPHENQINPIIIAIDAMDFSEEPENSFKLQLKEENLSRELEKAYTGFSAFEAKSIDTGHWGCGAFCGNRQLKTLVQWLAASASSNDLNYFCHGDQLLFSSLSPFIAEIISRRIKPGNLWSCLKSLRSESDINESNFIKTLEKRLFN